MFQTEVLNKGRTLCFDLENRPLAYWFDGQTTSEITAIAWKWSDRPVVRCLMLQVDGTFEYFTGARQRETVWCEDTTAYTLFRRELEEADVVYGHNIRKHDLPMFNAGLLRREIPPLKPLLTSDTVRDIPRRNGLSASLANLAAMYGLEGEKKSMSHSDWELSNRLTDEGIALARERVVGDVLLQEQLRNKLIELNLLKTPRRWTP